MLKNLFPNKLFFIVYLGLVIFSVLKVITDFGVFSDVIFYVLFIVYFILYIKSSYPQIFTYVIGITLVSCVLFLLKYNDFANDIFIFAFLGVVFCVVKKLYEYTK